MSDDEAHDAVEASEEPRAASGGRGGGKRGRGGGTAALAMEVEDDEPAKAIDICPADKRRQRACLCCGLVKTFEQFVNHGCNNCDNFLALRGNEDLVSSCTTGNFFGIVSMISPNGSWTARWQGIDKFKPGCYALKMKGQLPESIAEVLPAEMRARYEWMLEEESGRANGDQRQA